MVKSRGQHCGDIELAGYLANESGPVPLVLDLRIPNNIDQSLNDAAADKIRKYRADYNNRTPSAVSFIPDIGTTVRVGGYIVNLLDFYSYILIGKLTSF